MMNNFKIICYLFQKQSILYSSKRSMQTEPMSKPKVVSKDKEIVKPIDKENTDNSITSSNTLTSTQTTVRLTVNELLVKV